MVRKVIDTLSSIRKQYFVLLLKYYFNTTRYLSLSMDFSVVFQYSSLPPARETQRDFALLHAFTVEPCSDVIVFSCTTSCQQMAALYFSHCSHKMPTCQVDFNLYLIKDKHAPCTGTS